MVALASVGAGEQRKKGENVFICWHLWWWQLALFAREEWMDSTAEVSKDEKCEPLEKKNEYSTNSTIARITIQNLIERSCIGSIWAYPRTYLD